MITLGEDYPKEQARCRELLVVYTEIGVAGLFATHMIKDVLARADKAVMSGDIVAMITSYQEMKECN